MPSLAKKWHKYKNVRADAIYQQEKKSWSEMEFGSEQSRTINHEKKKETYIERTKWSCEKEQKIKKKPSNEDEKIQSTLQKWNKNKEKKHKYEMKYINTTISNEILLNIEREKKTENTNI